MLGCPIGRQRRVGVRTQTARLWRFRFSRASPVPTSRVAGPMECRSEDRASARHEPRPARGRSRLVDAYRKAGTRAEGRGFAGRCSRKPCRANRPLAGHVRTSTRNAGVRCRQVVTAGCASDEVAAACLRAARVARGRNPLARCVEARIAKDARPRSWPHDRREPGGNLS